MVDKVKPLKLEDPSKGTELDPYPTETDPSEDYIAAKGMAFECLDTLLIDSDSGEIQLTDTVSGTKKVSDLLDAEQENFDPTGSVLTSTKTGPAIREIAAGGIPIDALTEFEFYSGPSLESTTSDDWITKSEYPYTTAVKSAGEYVIDFTAQVGQSDKEKQVGSRFQWREGTSGTWIDLGDEILDAVSKDDAFQYRTSFFAITLSTDTEFQVRIQFGQTDDGGTGTIKEANIKLGKVAS